MGLGKWHVLSTHNNREVLIKEAGAAVLDKGEEFLGVLVVQVVEKDSANSARLSSVGVHEIDVTPLFEFRVVALVMFVTCRLEDLMEVLCVLFKEIRRGLSQGIDERFALVYKAIGKSTPNLSHRQTTRRLV